jgi:hypothetical protein
MNATTVLAALGCHLFLEMPPGHVLSELARENLPEVTARCPAHRMLISAIRIWPKLFVPGFFKTGV